MTEFFDREYKVRLSLNGRVFLKIVIDPHYEKSHSESIDDGVILGLLEVINGQDFPSQARSRDGFEYFAVEVVQERKGFRLILCYEDEGTELIVINCYRDRRIDATQ